MSRLLWRLCLALLLSCAALAALAIGAGRVLPSQGIVAYMALEMRGARLWTLDPQRGITLPLADHAFTGPPLFPSPDGQQLAFFRETLGSPHLYLMNIDGSGLRQLQGVTPDLAVVWMPDSLHIRVASANGSSALYDVWTLERTELPPPQVTGCGLPVVSPDGRRVATTLSEGNSAFFCNSRGIGVVNLDGGGDFSAFLPDEFVSAVWAPDSQHLALVGTDALYVVRDDDSLVSPQRVFSSSLSASASAPAWSPDGTKLALVGGSPFDIWMVPVLPVSASPVNLTPFNSMELYPAWSPDGMEIAFASSAAGSIEILVVDVATLETRRLTQNLMSELNLVWLP